MWYFRLEVDVVIPWCNDELEWIELFQEIYWQCRGVKEKWMEFELKWCGWKVKMMRMEWLCPWCKIIEPK